MIEGRFFIESRNDFIEPDLHTRHRPKLSLSTVKNLRPFLKLILRRHDLKSPQNERPLLKLKILYLLVAT